MAQKPKYSIVLIAKNEEKSLPRLFSSLREFLSRDGEVILLDTGSTDKTVELARSLGANVTEVGEKFVTTVSKEDADGVNSTFIVDNEEPAVKEGDRFFRFCDARNYAASLASNDMISMPDCDEEVTRMDIDYINDLIDKGHDQLEFNFVFAHDAYGNETVKFIQCKFYDRRVMHWEGIIHEVLQGNAKKRLLLPESVLKIEHWQNPETHRGGYLKGLALDCYWNKDKDRNSHYFARELLWNNRPKSAIKEFERHISMHRWPAEEAQSMLFIGDAYGMLNRPEMQVQWYTKGFQTDPSRREAMMRLAHFYKFNNNPAAAAAYAAAAMEIPYTGFYATNMDNYRQAPHEILYWAKGWMGDIRGAQEHLLKALEYLPYNHVYLRDTRFYFEYPDKGIEGWMRFPELQFLYNMAKKMDTICEVGSWKGRSTHALASGCKDGEITCVDHFEGSADEKDGTHGASGVYEQFLKNTSTFNNITVNKKNNIDAASDYPDKSFDMVFIDAGHTYEEVKQDIRSWRNKAKVLLCGHDYSTAWPDVMRAVDEEIGGIDGVADSIWYKWIQRPKVSIIIPTLGRPEKLNRLLRTIRENAGYDNYEVIVKVDQFPPNNVGVPKQLKAGVEESTGELVMYLGNDCVPEKDFLLNAVIKMLSEFPEADGLIGLNDGYWHGEFATHWLASKKLLPMLDGEFFHTGYYHTGCDNELTERCRKAGKYAYAENAKVFHDHPVHKGMRVEDMDAVYSIAYDGGRVAHDKALLFERAKQFGFNTYAAFSKPRVRGHIPASIDMLRRLPARYKNMRFLNLGLGAGTSSLSQQLQFLRCKELVHLEIHEPYIDIARKQLWDSKTDFILCDISDFDKFDEFDVVLAFDVLEHLDKDKAISVIDKVKRAGARMVVFLPLEKEATKHRDGTDDIESQEHRSTWTEEEFKNLGFKTELLPKFHQYPDELVDALWATIEPVTNE